MGDLDSQWYFEDIEVGYQGQGLSRTMDFSDIINFANFTRDYNVIHVDKESAKSGMFGQVIGHGMISPMIGSGMLLRTEFGTRTLSTMLELLGHNRISFRSPILVDDTLTLKFEVVDKREVDESTGIVEMQCNMMNQRDELVCGYGCTYLFARRGYDFDGIAARGSWH